MRLRLFTCGHTNGFAYQLRRISTREISPSVIQFDTLTDPEHSTQHSDVSNTNTSRISRSAFALMASNAQRTSEDDGLWHDHPFREGVPRVRIQDDHPYLISRSKWITHAEYKSHGKASSQVVKAGYEQNLTFWRKAAIHPNQLITASHLEGEGLVKDDQLKAIQFVACHLLLYIYKYNNLTGGLFNTSQNRDQRARLRLSNGLGKSCTTLLRVKIKSARNREYRTILFSETGGKVKLSNSS